METILNFVFNNNLQVPVIALITVILTGLLKIPVKRIAAKMKNGQKLTKYITFMPLSIGFGVTVLILFLSCGEINFENEFFVCWLSAVSLSLAIYAFWEKFVPDEKKILTRTEISENRALVEELENVMTKFNENLSESEKLSEVSEEFKSESHKKIILNSNKKGE